MKRLLVATVAAAALGAGFSAPAEAGCSGKIDLACGQGACSPDYPCTPMFCLVWYSSRCVV